MSSRDAAKEDLRPYVYVTVWISANPGREASEKDGVLNKERRKQNEIRAVTWIHPIFSSSRGCRPPL